MYVVCMYVMYVYMYLYVMYVCHVFYTVLARVTTVHTCGMVPGTVPAQCNFPDLGEKSQHQHDFCLKRVSLVLV